MSTPQPTDSPADDSLPTTSVVIPTYNRARDLEGLLAPLLRDLFPLEVVVVVDGCEDGSIEILERLRASDERLRPIWIENSGEMGARETGVARAKGEVVLMLDDDVWSEPGLVRAHAELHRRRPRQVVLGYMPTLVLEDATFATRLYAEEYEATCERYEAEPQAILRNFWAGNVSLRREDALAVGLHNPRYTVRYHQDQEFGLRCLEAGLVGVFDRRLRARHVHSRPLEAFRRDARAEGYGRRLLHRLHSEVLGPLPAAHFERDVPHPARALIQLSARPRAHHLIGASLTLGIRSAQMLKWRGAEIQLAKLLRRVEQKRGL